MKQVVQSLKSGEISVLDVPRPRLRDGGALVLTHASVISTGTERAKIKLGEKSLIGKARARPELARQVIDKARHDGLLETYRTVMQRLESPVPLGYSAAGEVIAVGRDCAGIKPGDLVACGGGGYANHAEVNFVPKNLLAKIPDGVSAEQAAYATIGAIAMQGVRQADVRLGDRVVVIGLGLVGLLTVQLVRAAGGRVLAIDIDSETCSLAAQLGADVAIPRGEPVDAAAASFTAGIGADCVLICASTPSSDPIELAGRLARDRARVVAVGDVGMTVPRDTYYEKELELRLSRSYGPGRYDPRYEEHGADYPIGYVRWTEQRNMEDFTRLLAEGAVDVGPLTTHSFEITEAADAYSLIAGKTAGKRPIGVILRYPRTPDGGTQTRVEAVSRRDRKSAGSLPLGIVGAGSFATRILLPTLARDERAEFVGVASAGGMTAQEVARRFGFRYATSDARALIEDPAIDAVVIATRHDSHAELSAAAIRAGKSVFCEKPLAISWEGLEDVASAYAAGAVPLLVGFNRRFSPLIRELRSTLPPGVPRSIMLRINAGSLSAAHWTSDPAVGGGRIIGELCHFLDLACYLAEGPPLRVSAEALGGADAVELNDSLAAQVVFGCGSVASIQYLANGDPTVPKERLEVFCGGGTALIDDFRTLALVRHGQKRTIKQRRQQKGHREELRAFVDIATGGEQPEILSPRAIFLSSALTLQIPRALTHGGAVTVALPRALGGGGASGSPDTSVFDDVAIDSPAALEGEGRTPTAGT